MQQTWTERCLRPLGWIAALAAIAVTQGCATNTERMLSHGDKTILDIWEQQTGGGQGSAGARQLLDARATLRRPVTDLDLQALPADSATYTRTAGNEIASQFRRLPNPDLVMYVFPHLAGTDAVPVPGYSTVFPLHNRVQYALPGERVENY
jgi:conjugative transfer region lipoprotein (TIGR03751 family)